MTIAEIFQQVWNRPPDWPSQQAIRLAMEDMRERAAQAAEKWADGAFSPDCDFHFKNIAADIRDLEIKKE